MYPLSFFDDGYFYYKMSYLTEGPQANRQASVVKRMGSERMDQPDIQTALVSVLELLSTNEVIIAYQKSAQRIENHQGIAKIVDDIKKTQQAGVAFEHYGKPQAAAEAFLQADQLSEQLANHPLVLAYRANLAEANSLLHSLTKQLEEQVNAGLASNCQKQMLAADLDHTLSSSEKGSE